MLLNKEKNKLTVRKKSFFFRRLRVLFIFPGMPTRSVGEKSLVFVGTTITRRYIGNTVRKNLVTNLLW